MKYKLQDQRISLFYVTDRILEILEEARAPTNVIKMSKMLEDFKNELLHNLGVNVLHNHFTTDKTRKDH